MSQYPPPSPPDPNYFYYESAPVYPEERAKSLIRLAVIFNFIMAGIDGVYGLLMFVAAFVVPLFLQTEIAQGGGAGGPPPPPLLLGVVYGGMGLLSLIVGIIKTIGAFKLLRRRPGAWGWGLAAGIAGCPQVWCSLLCLLPLACAIYTIVILCRQDVRDYLRNAAAESSTTMPAA